jgi:hypothetical protein
MWKVLGQQTGMQGRYPGRGLLVMMGGGHDQDVEMKINQIISC